MIRKISYKNKDYTLTFDEYRVLDTVCLKGTDVPLSSSIKDVQWIINKWEKIASYETIKGVCYL